MNNTPSLPNTSKASWRTLVLASHPHARSAIPYPLAKELTILPLACFDLAGRKEIQIGIPESANQLDILAKLKLLTTAKVNLISFPDPDIKKAIIAAYQLGEKSAPPKADSTAPPKSATVIAFDVEEKRSIPKYFRQVLLAAFHAEASDIHIQCEHPHAPRIAFRIHGILTPWDEHWSPHGRELLRHVQVVCGLDTTEHVSPQDGALSFDLDGNTVRARISVIPLPQGYKLAIRILHHYLLDQLDGRTPTFEELGLLPRQSHFIKASISAQSGLFLISGSTGSGKSTLLYTILEMLPKKRLNVLTIEDPIERIIPGCTQIEVDAQDVDFHTRTCRAILRQDPNIVVVGELRDKRVVETTLQAALSGILVFATMHAGSTQELIFRLFELGATPVTLASVLHACSFQRLVPQVCPHCAQTIAPSDLPTEIYQSWKADFWHSAHLKIGKGCTRCAGSGNATRIGVFETLGPTFPLILSLHRQYINAHPHTNHQVEQMITHGVSFKEALGRKILNGTVSPVYGKLQQF